MEQELLRHLRYYLVYSLFLFLYGGVIWIVDGRHLYWLDMSFRLWGIVGEKRGMKVKRVRAVHSAL